MNYSFSIYIALILKLLTRKENNGSRKLLLGFLHVVL